MLPSRSNDRDHINKQGAGGVLPYTQQGRDFKAPVV